jgi:Protein of unknown function (DUF2752)
MNNGTASKFLPAVVIVAGIAAVLLLLQFDPNQVGGPLPPCPFNWLTGLYCPGCGATRALHALIHGDVAKAFSMNPVFVFAMPVLALLMAQSLTQLPPSLAAIAKFFGDARPWAWLLISFTVLRNLPWYPFYLLAPG